MNQDLAVPKYKDTPMILRVSQIVRGKNPRTYFDPEEMAELVEGIKAQGVMQPILVRLLADGTYEIIAGERRWRAVTTAFGPEAEIPVLCREGASEDAVEAMALGENVIRAAMAVIEEAESLERILKKNGGDKQDAAKQVGLDVAGVNRLLAFLLLTPACRTALTHRKIKVGHAELLATVPAAKQDGALAKIIEHGISVAELKRQVGTLTNDLTLACFDRGECLHCPHNSAQQQVMFAEALEGSVCTNPPCYQGKVDAHLQVLADRLEQDVPKVIILRADTGIEPIKLVAEGKGGVGAEQAEACKGCANYGATVSGLPGDEGTVSRGMCFDAACNVKKVAFYMRSKRAPNATEAGTTAGAKAGTGPAATGSGKAARAPTVGAVSGKVKEYRVGQWRKMAAKVTYEHPELALSMLLSLVMSSHARYIDASKLREVHRALTKTDSARGAMLTITGAATAMVGVEANVVQRMLHACAASAFKELPEGALLEALRVLNVHEQDHWKLNTEYLTLLTKSEIEALAAELRLSQAAGDTAFKKLLAQPKPAFIAGLLAIEGVEYVGLVPQAMKYPRAAGAAEEVDALDDTDDAGTETQGAAAQDAGTTAAAVADAPRENATTAEGQPEQASAAAEATTAA